ncbi:MAG: ABC transporter permease subunit [Vicinamibacterales bacterium]
MSRAGRLLLILVALVTLSANWLSPNPPEAQFLDRAYAPPTPIHVRDADGFRTPFIYPQQVEDPVARTYSEDRRRPQTLRWFRDGRLVSVDAGAGPLFLLGADPLGRDVWARLLAGARLSLGVALLGLLGALVIGGAAGGVAGTFGGRTDAVLMHVADFLVVLPAAYVVLVLRGLVSGAPSTADVFWLMAGFFALAGWPTVARGVRAVVAAERSREYAEAARAAGAGPWRLVRTLLPAARGFLSTQAVLLLPALLLAEVTVSFVGLGFTEPAVSWGTMLETLANVRLLGEAPWLIAPALAVFIVVLGLQLAAGARGPASVLHLRDRPRGIRRVAGV